MADGLAKLDAWMARLRELRTLPQRVADDVAVALERELLANVARGVGPDGTPWPPTVDGHVPLQGARSALTVVVAGKSAIARLSDVYARHHFGAVRGGKRRPILPSGGIPARVASEVHRVVRDEFRRTMGGR